MRYRDRIYLVFDDLKTSSAADVAKTASRLGVTFPDGYAEYVTELGEGTLCNYLRIHLPKAIEEELPDHRRFLSEGFHWKKKGVLSTERARETVRLGRTLDGDSLVFHPGSPDSIFVLPRHHDEVYQTGPGLEKAISWLCESGTLTRPMKLLYFEPDGERARINKSIGLPYQTVRDAVVNLGLHDHVAFEEQSDDEEDVFEVQVKVGSSGYHEVDAEEAAISLLVKEFGGEVTISTGSLFNAKSTDVCIEHVPNPKSAKLDRMIRLLDELAAKGGKPKRRKW
jgi:hypothetical protein